MLLCKYPSPFRTVLEGGKGPWNVRGNSVLARGYLGLVVTDGHIFGPVLYTSGPC